MTGTSFWVLGIDPGQHGAVAALRADLSAHRIIKMPMLGKFIDTTALRAFFAELAAAAPIRHALLEKSQIMPSQGAVSGFTYGRNYGVLTTCLEFLGVPFGETSPAKWKLAIIGPATKLAVAQRVDPVPEEPLVEARSASQSAKKRAIKELAILTARRMFPGAGPFLKSEDGPAEAILIAEASRRLVLHGSMNGLGKAADLDTEISK